MYSLSLNVQFVNSFIFAIFLHICFGIWMYGSDQIMNDVIISLFYL